MDSAYFCGIHAHPSLVQVWVFIPVSLPVLCCGLWELSCAVVVLVVFPAPAFVEGVAWGAACSAFVWGWCHHRVSPRPGGSGARVGSPIFTLHGWQAAHKYCGSSPVAALPWVWCTCVAVVVHTSVRSWQVYLSRARTYARIFRHAGVDPPAHALLIAGWLLARSSSR